MKRKSVVNKTVHYRTYADCEAKVNPSSSDWQMEKESINARGKYVLEKGEWSDCKFIVGTDSNQQEFNAHKLFLAMSSPVFEAMFFGKLAEQKYPIPILDVQPEAFRSLLEYIYTEAINIQSFDHALNLCYAAKKYLLPHLTGKCMKYLEKNLSPQNVCRGYEFAKMFEEAPLKDKCLQIFQTDAERVLQEQSFEEIQLTTLTEILEQEKLNISSELILFDAVQRWARQECIRKGLSPEASTSLQSVLGTAIGKIRYLTLTPAEFAEGPAVSPLLTRDQSFTILLSISSQSKSSTISKKTMPEGFSTSTEPRGKNVARLKRSYCYIGSNEKVTTCIQITAPWSSSVNFSVNKDIRILGIQVTTQEPNPIHSYAAVQQHNTTYMDNTELRLLCSGDCLAVQTSRQEVNHNSIMDIIFDNPIDIQRAKLYQIKITRQSTGFYPENAFQNERNSCSDTNVIFNVTLTFEYNYSRCTNGTIRSIIFTH